MERTRRSLRNRFSIKLHHPSSIVIVGEYGCGKPTLVLDLMTHANSVFSEPIQKIIYVCNSNDSSLKSFVESNPIKTIFLHDDDYLDVHLQNNVSTLLIYDCDSVGKLTYKFMKNFYSSRVWGGKISLVVVTNVMHAANRFLFPCDYLILFKEVFGKVMGKHLRPSGPVPIEMKSHNTFLYKYI